MATLAKRGALGRIGLRRSRPSLFEVLISHFSLNNKQQTQVWVGHIILLVWNSFPDNLHDLPKVVSMALTTKNPNNSVQIPRLILQMNFPDETRDLNSGHQTA